MVLGEAYPSYAVQEKFGTVSHKYKDIVFTLINNAFGRNYSEDDIFEVRPGGVLYIMSDKVRRYDFVTVSGILSNKMACMVESESSSVSCLSSLTCNEDTLWIQVNNIAVIRSMRYGMASRGVRCVIDAPGGTIDYGLDVVFVEGDSLEMTELLKLMSEEE